MKGGLDPPILRSHPIRVSGAGWLQLSANTMFSVRTSFEQVGAFKPLQAVEQIKPWLKQIMILKQCLSQAITALSA